jgi:hypothetical protein
MPSMAGPADRAGYGGAVHEGDQHPIGEDQPVVGDGSGAAAT